MKKTLIIKYSPLFLAVALVVALAFFSFFKSTRASNLVAVADQCVMNDCYEKCNYEISCIVPCEDAELQKWNACIKQQMPEVKVPQCAPLFQMPCDADCAGLSGAGLDSCIATCNNDNLVRKRIYDDCNNQGNKPPTPKEPETCKYKVNGRACDGVVEECAPGCPAKTVPLLNTPQSGDFAMAEAADEAQKILDRPDKIKLAPSSETGKDTASEQNITDVANQTCAKTGLHKCVYLSPKLLQSMLKVSDKFGSITVSSIVGGDHCGSPNLKKSIPCRGVSNHYRGQSIDISRIDDNKIVPKDKNKAPYKLMKACLAAGFNDVIGPNPFPKGARNLPGHNDHVHCGFK